MQKIIFGLAAAAVLMGYVAAPAAFAQAGMLVATIPFDFYVGDKKLHAGEYTANVMGGFALRLRGRDGRSVATVGTMPFLDKSASPNYGKFIFTRYGDQYFLRQAVWAGYGEGRELLKSNRELEIARGRLKADEVKVVGDSAAPGRR